MFLHHPGSLDKLVPLVLASITAGTLTLTACSPATEHNDFSEPYWVLFRFLYGGQFVDPCLIIAGDYLVGSSVSECLV